jgi:osmotically-inducible protein OsmY
MFGPESFNDGGVAVLLPPPVRHVDSADLAERALRNSPYLVLRNVTCACQNGVLTLRGYLPTYYLKQVAQAVVAHVDGVRQVVNEIEVVCGGMREVRRASF